MRIYLGSLALFALLTGWALADSCVAVKKPTVAVKAAVVNHAPAYAHAHAYDAAFFPVAVFTPVPLFTVQAPAAHPAPPVASSAPAPVASGGELHQVLQAIQQTNQTLQGLDARIKKLEQGLDGPIPLEPARTPPPAAPKVQSKADAGIVALRAKCASCHEAKVAADKGGGLTLLDGVTPAKLDDRQKRRVLTLSYSGKMPPPSSGVAALTDEEVGAIVSLVDSLK